VCPLALVFLVVLVTLVALVALAAQAALKALAALAALAALLQLQLQWMLLSGSASGRLQSQGKQRSWAWHTQAPALPPL
jgi:hypothetical protein